MQFNMLSKKWWTQLVADPRGMAPTDTNVGDNAGAGPVQIGLNYGMDTSYLVQPLGAPFVTELDTGIPNTGLLDGSLSYVCSMAGLKAAISLVDSSGNVLYNHPWDLLDAPYIFDYQVVGQYSGQHLDFTALEGVLDYLSSRPVQGYMGPNTTGLALDQLQWGTYADPTLFGGKAFPLYWMNETGESSDVWTNVLFQDPTHVRLGYSLVEGNQLFSNPPLSTTEQATALTIKVS